MNDSSCVVDDALHPRSRVKNVCSGLSLHIQYLIDIEDQIFVDIRSHKEESERSDGDGLCDLIQPGIVFFRIPLFGFEIRFVMEHLYHFV